MGTGQHDAQELLTVLLDGMHEVHLACINDRCFLLFVAGSQPNREQTTRAIDRESESIRSRKRLRMPMIVSCLIRLGGGTRLLVQPCETQRFDHRSVVHWTVQVHHEMYSVWKGQLKRRASVYHDCLQESLSFDPFTSLSVPVSKRTVVDVIVIYRTNGKPSVKVRATADTLALPLSF